MARTWGTRECRCTECRASAETITRLFQTIICRSLTAKEYVRLTSMAFHAMLPAG